MSSLLLTPELQAPLFHYTGTTTGPDKSEREGAYVSIPRDARMIAGLGHRTTNLILCLT